MKCLCRDSQPFAALSLGKVRITPNNGQAFCPLFLFWKKKTGLWAMGDVAFGIISVMVFCVIS